MGVSEPTGEPQKPATPKPGSGYWSGFFTGIGTVVLVAWLVLLIVALSSHSVIQISGTPVHSARISHSLAVARAYWAAHGRRHGCSGSPQVVMVTNEDELVEPGAHAVADTVGFHTCPIQIIPEVYYSYTWEQLCTIAVHEYGHVVGLADNHKPASIMDSYVDVDKSSVIPSVCKHPGDSRRYRPPIDTPATTCLFLIDQRLPGLSYGRVQHCGKVVNLTVPHAAIAGSSPAACLDVETVRPLPPEWTFDGHFADTIANPRGCHHLQVDIVAAGRSETKRNEETPVDFYEGSDYNRPYLEG